jgi:hypothetical protein
MPIVDRNVLISVCFSYTRTAFSCFLPVLLPFLYCTYTFRIFLLYSISHDAIKFGDDLKNSGTEECFKGASLVETLTQLSVFIRKFLPSLTIKTFFFL